MLANRSSGQPSTFVISILDDSGSKIDATSASWELLDARGETLTAGAVADFNADLDNVSIEIDGEDLTITETSEGREIVVFLATEAGQVEVRDYFLIVANSPLALMVNSLVTYPEALALRQSFGLLDGWDGTLERDARSSALADAYERLMRMSYSVPLVDPMTVASGYAAYGGGADSGYSTRRRIRLRGLLLATFDALPADFQRAIKRAQMVEADMILGGDKASKFRRDGIIMDRIGESSTTYSDKPYLNLPISRSAFDEIKRFVIIQIGIARA